jgi:hypothetical protein
MAAINAAAVAPVAPVHARGRPSRSYRKQYRTLRERDGPLRHMVVALRRLGQIERFPFERNRSNDKKSLKIKMLEQALIEKVYQLFRSLL